MTIRSRTALSVLLLLALSGMLTLTLQHWLGQLTQYNPEFAAKRLALHEMLRTGEGDTATLDAPGTMQRVFAVYLADAIHRWLGLPVLRAYQAVDTVALFLFFGLLPVYLRRWAEPALCLAGVLFTANAMVLTYFLHWFNPWDRISILAWLLLLFAMRERKLLLIGPVLVLAVLIKYDAVVTPALYGLYTLARRPTLRWAVTVGGLFVVSFGTLAGLSVALQGGLTPGDLAFRAGAVWKFNVANAGLFGLAHPALLMFLLPLLLAVPTLRHQDRFAACSAVFGLVLLVFLFLMTFLHEVRALMPVLLLLLPAAVANLQHLLRPSTEPAATT